MGGAALGAAVAPGVGADGGGLGVGGGMPGGEGAQGREVLGAGRHPAALFATGDRGGVVAVAGEPDGPGPPGDTLDGGFAVRGRHGNGRPFLWLIDDVRPLCVTHRAVEHRFSTPRLLLP